MAQATAANGAPGATQPEVRIKIGTSPGRCDAGTTRFQGPTGERWTFTAGGQVTNPAARLSAQARGGQILQAEETARCQHGHFPVQCLGAVALKNPSHPVIAWEARRPVAQQQTDIDSGAGPA